MLNLETLHETAAVLAGRDADLARVVDAFGPPPLWAREPGFGTLVYIILEQQVSLASAKAAYLRLSAAIDPLSPDNFLTLDDSTLKAIGFSRQKMAYSRILAQAILDGELNLAQLEELEDEAVRVELTRIKGIGRWTADIYLMQALLRPDVWPTGDLALAVAVQRVKNLEAVPGPAALYDLGETYRPWRAVAARLFWHYYLSSPARIST
ncbi:MAG: DNA-3-methyladenine glycosylase 2 family protein [Anaerolineaceae bacterium]|nr:DNA-3-methyladenine glycosylase 2 family protein [Anaerolineaceae bacterium]